MEADAPKNCLTSMFYWPEYWVMKNKGLQPLKGF